MKSSIIPFKQSVFNNLPSIEVANENVQVSNKLNRALKVLGPIFLKHNMFNTWGISLLHKHFVIDNTEKPIQDIYTEEKRKTFVTIPRTNSFIKEYFPSVYKLENGKEVFHSTMKQSVSASQKNVVMDTIVQNYFFFRYQEV